MLSSRQRSGARRMSRSCRSSPRQPPLAKSPRRSRPWRSLLATAARVRKASRGSRRHKRRLGRLLPSARLLDFVRVRQLRPRRRRSGAAAVAAARAAARAVGRLQPKDRSRGFGRPSARLRRRLRRMRSRSVESSALAARRAARRRSRGRLRCRIESLQTSSHIPMVRNSMSLE